MSSAYQGSQTTGLQTGLQTSGQRSGMVANAPGLQTSTYQTGSYQSPYQTGGEDGGSYWHGRYGRDANASGAVNYATAPGQLPGGQATGIPPWQEPHKYAQSRGFHFGGFWSPHTVGHTWWQEAVHDFSQMGGRHLPANVASHELSQMMKSGQVSPQIASLREQYYQSASPRALSRLSERERASGIGGGIGGGLSSITVPYAGAQGRTF